MFIAPNYKTYQLKSVEFNDIPFDLFEVTKYDNNTISYEKVNNFEIEASILL